MSSAASPLANASPWLARSSAATCCSTAVRVGLPDREYSYPWCTPTSLWAKVVDSEIGVTTAPVDGSGGCPAWIAAVSKAQPDCCCSSPMGGGPLGSERRGARQAFAVASCS